MKNIDISQITKNSDNLTKLQNNYQTNKQKFAYLFKNNKSASNSSLVK